MRCDDKESPDQVIARLKYERDAARAEVASMARARNEVQTIAVGRRTEIERLTCELATARTKIERLTCELTTARTEIEQLTSTLAVTRTKIERLTSALVTIRAEVASMARA